VAHIRTVAHSVSLSIILILILILSVSAFSSDSVSVHYNSDSYYHNSISLIHSESCCISHYSLVIRLGHFHFAFHCYHVDFEFRFGLISILTILFNHYQPRSVCHQSSYFIPMIIIVLLIIWYSYHIDINVIICISIHSNLPEFDLN